MKTNALHSLWGDGHQAARKSEVTKLLSMPGERNQVVLTPQCIVDGLRVLWADGIAYDAAGSEYSLLQAQKVTMTRGLLDPWPDRTFCNPPYGPSLVDPEIELPLLRKEKAIRELAKKAGRKSPKFPPGLPIPKASLNSWLSMQLVASEGESVLLAPNRTHRKWMRQWRREVDAIVELNPITFEGWKQAFPAPLVLGFVCRPRCTRERIGAFWDAFSHIGDPA